MLLKGCLLLPLASLFIVDAQAEDTWSWGTDDGENITTTDLQESQPKDANIIPPVTPDLASTEHLLENGTNVPTGRFFGFKEKLCKLGLGKNCNKNIQPAVQSNHGPVSKPLVPSSSYGPPSSPQSPSSSYTSYDQHQTGQYKPPGKLASLPAVIPLPPKPFHPIKGILNNLGSHFAIIDPSHHKKPYPTVPLPSQVSNTLLPSFVTAATSIHQKPAHNTIKHDYVASQVGIQQSIVQHIHSHTHIHQSLGASSIQTVTLIPPRHTTTIIQPVTVATIHPSVVTSQTVTWTHISQPTFVPSPSQPIPSPPSVGLEVETSFRKPEISLAGKCQCVPESYCELSDVVSYSSPKDISHLLDPRNSNTEILSNATELQEITTKSTTLSTEQLDDAKVKNDTTHNPKTDKESVEKRIHRDIKNYPANLASDRFIKDVQGRIINGYTPGPNGCESNHVCCRNPLYPSISPKFTCGRSNRNGFLGRVKTPHHEEGDTEFGEYPWQAAILKNNENSTNSYVCGGVLIGDLHILTAAHCVDGLNHHNLKVRLGEWDVAQTSEFFQHIDMDVVKINIHKDYYKGNLQNDIAALTLRSKVDFSNNPNFPHISPVCLPNALSDFTNQACTVTGWGKDAFGNHGKFQHVLKEVSVPVVDRHQCQENLRRTRLGADFDLQDGMLCAGGEQDKDACKGDGGSPLVCRDTVSGSYHLAGLVSWGIGCGQSRVPGVYVNISHYLQWISDISHSGTYA
ncbi:unnamed protein product [Meganyctiphanes norvegica]|uniref:Peptidase S1 domain-containing protein n=1 Tax=Meganyctiphanes norvegica TaxID=48144 RepID=A0AAV2R190_MEGNR